MNKIKAWIIYGGSPSWYSASLVLENGLVIGGHLCSDPGYMKLDLIGRHPERSEALKRMGLILDLQGEPIAGSDYAPEWLIEKNANTDSYKDFEKEYLGHLEIVKADWIKS